MIEEKNSLPENYAFTDGSYNIATKTYGFGGFLVYKGGRVPLSGSGNDPKRAASRNIAGEVLGAMEAVSEALKLGLNDLVIYYDYIGIEYWATGKWKTNKELTKEYAAFMQSASKRIRLHFVHVKAHSGIPGNEEADTLAKAAVGLIEDIGARGVKKEEPKSSGRLLERFLGRKIERIRRAAGAIDSAVLIPVIEKDGKLQILFEVRQQGIAQGGEICFPGGRIEKGETPRQAAEREACEELKILPDQIETICPLYEITGPGGGSVYSFLSVIHSYEGTFSSSEVERIFCLPADELKNREPIRSFGTLNVQPDEDFPYELIPGGRAYPFRKIRREYFFYETKHGVIWGLTGELLYRFLQIF